MTDTFSFLRGSGRDLDRPLGQTIKHLLQFQEVVNALFNLHPLAVYQLTHVSTRDETLVPE